VRQPQLVARALNEAGLLFPDIARTADDIPRDATWLLKALRSAGGGQVRVWDAAAPRDVAESYYLQRRIEGASFAAVFVAAGGTAALLGVTRQLVGASWAGATGFQYCGSIGPVDPQGDLKRQFAAIGQTLAHEFSLTGLFGVDAIVNSAGVWPVEVNPRYTASVEVLERALGISAINVHLRACRDAKLPGEPVELPERIVGKAIVFAPTGRVAADAWADTARERLPARLANPADWPPLADVPPSGAMIEAGWPILTVFANGINETIVLESLQSLVAEIQATP